MTPDQQEDWEAPRAHPRRGRVLAAAATLALVAGLGAGLLRDGGGLAVEHGEAGPVLAEVPVAPVTAPPLYGPSPEGVERLAGRWRRVAAPGFASEGPSLDWTGSHLLLWGGRAGGRYLRSGSRYDPAGDTWDPIPPAPLPGRPGHESVWTGSELLVWGGSNARSENDGAAYDPEQRTWRVLADAPLEPSHRTVSVWTGDELLVVAGSAVPSAAAYDPAADTWRSLPDPPPHGHRVGAVWTGTEMVVVSDALDGTVVRFDPATGRWSLGADQPDLIPTYGVEVAWTGEEVLVWGGGVGRPSFVGWAYHPGGNRWRRIPGAWAGGTLDSAGSVWAGRYWVVLGSIDEGFPALAAYDPAGDRWLALPPPGTRVHLTGPLAWTGEEVVGWSLQGAALAFRPER